MNTENKMKYKRAVWERASIAQKKLIECYSGECESNSYKEYYYIDKLADYGHRPSMKTREIMRQDGIGCDRTLEMIKPDIAGDARKAGCS